MVDIVTITMCLKRTPVLHRYCCKALWEILTLMISKNLNYFL